MSEETALSAVPAAGERRRRGEAATLEFFHGPMDCGKSTLALQIDHNHTRQGRSGLLLVRHDRSGEPRITSRLGMSKPAVEVPAGADLTALVRSYWARGDRVDYLVIDEAQFLDPEQVDQLADLVDGSCVDVYAFGISTDFRGRLFPGAQRLVELADTVTVLQVEVLCWCGRRGRMNARVVGGRIVREGDTVLVADTSDEATVHYQVLCREHHRAGELGPAVPAPDQLRLS